MSEAQNGFSAHNELSELRRQVASLEDRWADVHNSLGPAKRDASFNGHPALAQVSQYLVQGNQYRVANPGPLGLYAFGYTTALLQGFNTKWTESGTNNWVYGFALFFGGLIQLLAGMWDFYRNNLFGGTAFSCYGCLSFIFFIATLMINIGLQVLLFSLTVTFFLLAAGEDAHPRVTKAGGYLGVWTAAVAWYIATAELLNSVYRRKVLPLGVINAATKEPSMTGVARPDTL